MIAILLFSHVFPNYRLYLHNEDAHLIVRNEGKQACLFAESDTNYAIFESKFSQLCSASTSAGKHKKLKDIMELKDIIAISGQPGLFKYVAQSTNGIIIESLGDGKRSNATGSSKVSALAEIAVFTDDGERPLSKILEALFAKTGGKETISSKSAPELLKAHFAEIVPDYDRDRVHVSDMKKIISWYNLLIGTGMTDFSVKEPEEAEVAEAAE